MTRVGFKTFIHPFPVHCLTQIDLTSISRMPLIDFSALILHNILALVDLLDPSLWLTWFLLHSSLLDFLMLNLLWLDSVHPNPLKVWRFFSFLLFIDGPERWVSVQVHSWHLWQFEQSNDDSTSMFRNLQVLHLEEA